MTKPADIRIAYLYRYPVKGLSPERVARAELETSGYFPGDRLYAIENGPSGFNEVAPRHLAKLAYLMLMRNEALARLKTRFDHDSHRLTIAQNGSDVLEADLRTPEGRGLVAEFMADFLPHELRGEAWVLEAPPGFRFTDARMGFVSLLNLASVSAIEDFVNAPVDHRRFRSNIFVEGLEPWAELDFVGRVFEAPSGARLKVTARTERCAATNVDPDTGIRDLKIPHALLQQLGHTDCGVYAEVIWGGSVAEGDVLTPVG